MLLKIVLAGGCFWSMQVPFDDLKSQGVTEVKVGFSGGYLANPTYKEVVQGGTGHYEVVEVTYDSNKITLEKLLETYWTNIDPLNDRGQFCDAGERYRTAIFYSSDEERKLAEKTREEMKKRIKESGDFKTEIIKLKDFFPAEKYHQNFYIKNPKTYKTYKFVCRRENRLEKLWGATATK